MAHPWNDRIRLAVSDFLEDLLEELRYAIKQERRLSSSARRRSPNAGAHRARSAAERDAQTRAARLERERASAWRALERIVGTPPVHPTAENARQLVRKARARTHPDARRGKSAREFLRVQRAAETLSEQFGVKL